MPELPEVETVRRGLEILAPAGTRIKRVELRRPDLRFPIPKNLPRRLAGQEILAYRRIGKFLMWDLPRDVLLCHLGMTGTWREAKPGDERKHDHAYIHLTDGRRLAYRDPRRFGLLDLFRPGEESQNRHLKDLGPDAIDTHLFTAAYVKSRLRGRRVPIKSMLLDQRLVAGIGNIYACEALFRARVRPRVAAGRLSLPKVERIVSAVHEVLADAIEAGGSTLRDFRQAGGESGYFQHRFAVYGRDGQPCLHCESTLKGAFVAGRSTVWCPACQA